jgi:hypothetical protein
MRRRGASLREIARVVGVALSTASVWTRDIAPPSEAPLAVAEVAPPLLEAVLRCSRCCKDLPESAFNRFRAGRQSWCRPCFRSYYEERKEHHRRRNEALKTRRIAAARFYVMEHLLAHRCSDCGEPDPLVLEFDHLGEKDTEVSTLIGRGVRLERLHVEIARCEVVCANCHRRRTARRAGWKRLDPEAAGLRYRSPAHERNTRHVYAVLRRSGCVDCGTKDLVVLEFDHVGTKTATVTQLIRREASLARIDREIAQCEVRCVNCHRRRTARALGHHRARYPQGELNPRYQIENLAC